MQGRCQAAHVDDSTECEGDPTAVIIEDSSGTSVTGCVRHGAQMLASIKDSKVRPGHAGADGAAIETFKRSKKERPFGFFRK